MPATMSPSTLLVLSWDMIEGVATIEPENGQSMDVDTKWKFDVPIQHAPTVLDGQAL